MRKKTNKSTLVEFGEEMRKEEERLAKIASGELIEEIPQKFSFPKKIKEVQTRIKSTLQEIIKKKEEKRPKEYIPEEQTEFIIKESNKFIESIEKRIRHDLINKVSLFSLFKSTEQQIKMCTTFAKRPSPKVQDILDHLEDLKTTLYNERKKREDEKEVVIQKHVVKEDSLEEDLRHLQGKKVLYTTKTSGKTYESNIKEVWYEPQNNQYVMSIQFDDEKAKNKGTGTYFKYKNKKEFIQEVNDHLQLLFEVKNPQAEKNNNIFRTKEIILNSIEDFKQREEDNNKIIPIYQEHSHQELHQEEKVG